MMTVMKNFTDIFVLTWIIQNNPEESSQSKEWDLGRGLSLCKAAAIRITTCIRFQMPCLRAIVTNLHPYMKEPFQGPPKKKSEVETASVQPGLVKQPSTVRQGCSHHLVWLFPAIEVMFWRSLFCSLFLETASSVSDWLSWYLFSERFVCFKPFS